MKKLLLSVLLIGASIGAFAQSTTIFRDSRWFDPNSDLRWYSKPIMAASSVTVTPDSIVARLGETTRCVRDASSKGCWPFV